MSICRLYVRFADGIPADGISVLVMFDIFRPRLHGPMRRGVGDVKKKGPALLRAVIDHLHGMIGDEIGVVEI